MKLIKENILKTTSKTGKWIMKGSDVLDEKARQAIGKPTEIDASGFQYVPIKGSDYLRMEKLPPEKTAEIEANYMNQGRPEVIIGKVSRAIWGVGYRIERNDFKPGVIKNLEHKKNEFFFFKELKEARRISWDSWIIARHGETLHIDGWLTLPSGQTRQFDIVCAASENGWIKEAISSGGAQDYSEHDLHGILLPGETVTPEGIEVALRGWYMSLYEFTPMHWCYTEKRLPEFIINCPWEDCGSPPSPDNMRKEETTNKELVELLSTDTARETFSKFGQEPIPDSLKPFSDKTS